MLLSTFPGEAYPQIALEVAARSPARGHMTAGLAQDQLGYLIAPYESYPEPIRRSFFNQRGDEVSPIDNDNYFFNVSQTMGERVTCSALRGAARPSAAAPGCATRARAAPPSPTTRCSQPARTSARPERTSTRRIIGAVSPGEDTADLLGRVEVFSDLERPELEQVAHVAVPRTFARGEVIFREGDSGDTCYIVRSGSVSIQREHADGRTVTLAELLAGAMFGELALFRGETRSATAEALEPTALLAVLGRDMQRVIASSPAMALKMLATMAERVRRTNERLTQHSFQTVAGRVASALLDQATARQAEGRAGQHDVLIQATQAEIAQLAGTSRESASRFLATLERERVVALSRGKVTVHEPERLRDFIH